MEKTKEVNTMDTHRFFTKQVIPDTGKPGVSLRSKISFSKLFTLIVVLLALLILLFQAYAIVANAVKAWPEIQFAYTKPELVHAVRVEYQTKEAALNQSLSQTQETAQEKLVNTVVKQLQQSK
jgi:hypothetical protein